jgi:hypothetical protein
MIEKEKDRVEMKEDGKTRMTRNRQTKGEKDLEVVGKHDLTGFLPPAGNYELRITNYERGREKLRITR